MKLAILTGGGDCPGLNAVIRAAAKTAILEHKAEVVGVKDGFEGLIHGRFRPLAYMDVSGILAEGGTILGTSNRANPFKYPFTSAAGEARFEDVSDRCVENFRKCGADVLIVIGGDGTMSIAHGLGKKGIPCVGIPKTIDNDLRGTDRTFGYDTAMRIAAEAIDMLHTTAQAHHRVMIVEVMGRNAGWIALGAGVAGGGDVVLIPEIPYDIQHITSYLLERRSKGKRFSIVVVAEGAKPAGGEVVVSRRVADGAEPIRLGGIGAKLCEEIEDATGMESRAVVLGHLQRGGPPTPFDRVLATRFGYEAAKAAMGGKEGIMIGLHGTEIGTVPMEEAAGGQRLVEPDCHLMRTARAVGTCFGDGILYLP